MTGETAKSPERVFIHDLATPLSVLHASLRSIRRQFSDENKASLQDPQVLNELGEKMDRMQRAVDRMAELLAARRNTLG